ncbi:MAG: LarC family nickel insertion protein [Lachnospiraceae bacterium]|nr:LarC family nickel insertion protein [Lachnospiraceae bacterium]
MKELYLDLSMGIAGDMFSGALLQLLEENRRSEVLAQLNSLGLQDVVSSVNNVTRCGINGLALHVKISEVEEVPEEVVEDHHHHEDHHHEHHHHHGRSLRDVEEIIDGLSVKDSIKHQVKEVYKKIAIAEGKAHGKEVGEIHFHEVGMLDAIFDVTAACVLMDELAVEKVISTPVCVGKGKVKCAHGILDVPAPATKYILEDENLPYYYSDKELGELCTPTGAAILAHFVTEFLSEKELDLDQILEDNKITAGFGMGHKNFEKPNCVKAYINTLS